MRNLKLVPEARRDAVRAALQTTFGRVTVGEMRRIVGGVSGALILRFEILGRPYVLRLEPERTALHDRQRGFACMQAAAAAGAAPHVHYADPAAGISIMDCVSSRPLSEHPGRQAGLVGALGGLLAQVRAATPFPTLGDYPDMIGVMLAALSRSGLFAPGLLAPHAEGLARIQVALPWSAASLVSSHNDPNPRNILFDGERLWLVDWELAFRNDPLVDIAILTFDLAETAELEDRLLQATFHREPDPPLRARLSVMRLLTRLFYGCVVLDVFANEPGRTPETSVAAFTPLGFRSAVAEGQLASGAQETAYAFGKMSLAAFIDGISTPGFSDILKAAEQG